MANSYWKTSSDSPKREKVHWPSAGQIIRQAAIAVVVTVAWTGLLVGCVSQAGLGGQVQSTAPVSESEAVAAETEVEPANTSTPLPTDTAVPTDTPAPTSTSPTTELEETTVPDEQPGEATETPIPELAPTLAPTETAAPTDTLAPAPDPDIPVADGEAGVSFANDVLPIFERRCIKCHGGPKDDGSLRIEEGLYLRTYAGLLEGSWNGPVIEPGNAEESYLVEQIVTGEMPKREPRLLPGEIRTITDWVNAGAPDN